MTVFIIVFGIISIGGNMAITKTNFINYSRCPRYVALDDIKKEKLNSMVSLEEYKKEEESEKLREILGNMFDDDGNDLIDTKNEHLEVMMPYYNMVELLAGNLAPKYFPGTFKYSASTMEQESFDTVIDNIRYLCYVDIYNETSDGFNIIEAKATTTKKFLDLGCKVDGEFNSIFMKDSDGIYKLLEDLDVNIEDYMPTNKYEFYRAKLFDRFGAAGHYVYDLAVQRYIIENDLKDNGESEKIPNVKYYLTVLNADYVFDGKYECGEPVYDTDSEGNDIVCFLDLTSITRDFMDRIDLDRKRVAGYINDLNMKEVPLGDYCEKKKTTKCKYCKICWDRLPEKNSIMAYIDGHHGFKDPDGNKYSRFDLINDGCVRMLDVPERLLNREKNVIQRRAVESNIPYMNKEKIIDGIKQLEYPIYHLDFETFPCPLPRFRGEKCYTQSVFQFSLHIESEPGVCDKEKNHYGFLAPDHLDRREELVKLMCELIGDKGTVLVYNDSFEKTRLKELAEIFPGYRMKLLKIRDMIFDLMNIVKTKSSLYEELGYSKEEAKMFNYYASSMNGSFSIKKVLPIFSDLTYQGMEIGNGVDALIAYANFPKMNELDFKHKYGKLVEYCKQDTWAMFCVLEGLKASVK